MRPSQDIIQPLAISALWFITTFFAVWALAPIYIALGAALTAMLLAVLWLLWLRHIEMAEHGAPAAMLWVTPITIGACAISWWIAWFFGLFG